MTGDPELVLEPHTAMRGQRHTCRWLRRHPGHLAGLATPDDRGALVAIIYGAGKIALSLAATARGLATRRRRQATVPQLCYHSNRVGPADAGVHGY